MATKHLVFDAQQRPFEITPSPDDKCIYSTNFISKVAGITSTYLQEVAQHLVDAGLGLLRKPSVGANLFLRMKTPLPTTGEGPFVRLLATSGLPPDISFSNDSIIDQPGLQVLVYGDVDVDVETQAIAIYENLIAVTNESLSP